MTAMYIQAETPADLGRYLRDVRESQGLDLGTVAAHLHIRVRYLESLENGNLSELPGAPYIRGYVLNYAGYLGLDRQHILHLFEQVSGQKPRHIFYIPEPNRKENAPGPGVMILAVVIIALAYLLWYAVLRSDGDLEMDVAKVPESLLYRLHHRPVDLTGSDCFGYKIRYYPPCYPPLTESLPERRLISEVREWPEIKNWPQEKARRERLAREEQQRLQQEQLQQIEQQPVQHQPMQQQPVRRQLRIQEQVVQPNANPPPQIP